MSVGGDGDGDGEHHHETAAYSNSKLRRRRVKSILYAFLIILLLFLAYMIADRSEIQVTTDGMMTKSRQQEQQHCVIHIHGFHHSGTGLLRETVYESLGEEYASTQVSHKPENEGQYLQDVFPNFYDRTKLFRHDQNFARYYDCPEMLGIVSRKTRRSLFQEWSQYWNMTKPFLIQKNPTLDVLFLERMKLCNTIHVIVMRHPFSWRVPFLASSNQKTRPGFFTLCTWLKVFTRVFEILPKVKSFAVVNYESLVEHPDEISHELSNLIQSECGIAVGNQTTTMPPPRRRLELRHSNSSSQDYLIPTNLTLRKWKFCNARKECHELMDKLTPIIAEFGYSWDRDDYFNGVGTLNQVLYYSKSKLPPKDVVENMKELAVTYCSSI